MSPLSALMVAIALLGAATLSARADDCAVSCRDRCAPETEAPPVAGVEPGCWSRCMAARPAACRADRPPPSEPQTSREQLERATLQACAAPFSAITAAVIARCASWPGRLDGQDLIAAARRRLLATGILAKDEFDGVEIRWCPLINAQGMTPDGGRIYLDVGMRQNHIEEIASSLAHEMLHVRQYREMGADEFRCAYSRAFIDCRACQDERHPMEREAYAFQRAVERRLAAAASPRPSADPLRPSPPAPLAPSCVTPSGACAMARPLPPGSGCSCPNAAGRLHGRAR